MRIKGFMKVTISDHFTVKKLIRFVFPSVVMMLFTSVYGVVDGLFVSNFAGKTAFAGVNLILPFIMLVGTFGFMVGQGGTAIVSKTLGQGNAKKANRIFSMLVLVVIISGALLSLAASFFIEKIAIFLGADEALLPYCVTYARISFISMPAFMLQNVFQSFFITAGKPNLGLGITVGAGVTNMLLDFILVGVLKTGVRGAAYATVVSELIGGLLPLIYFSVKNSSLLHFDKPLWDFRALLKTCTNGSSELMTNVSLSIVNMLYNYRLMRLAGADGVSAYGVIMYVGFVFVAVFIGYSIGVAPIIGFNYGAKNNAELKNMFKKSLWVISAMAVSMCALAFLLSIPLSNAFAGYDEALYSLTLRGFRIFSLSFLLSGFNIFGSSFFTALSNGAVSAAISFMRTLFFQVVCVLLLPIWFGVDGIFASSAAAELLALCVTSFFILKMNRRYNYIP